ncbi:hypothetical protein HanPI659440_Chr05g0195231 [Helianthus annuus]|nr:hypothetical protein HanPI659440_Chr05g0195231 [Helianthus annuus]
MRGGSRGKGWVLPPSAAHDLQFPHNIQHPPSRLHLGLNSGLLIFISVVILTWDHAC